jgi:hypothetical protein
MSRHILDELTLKRTYLQLQQWGISVDKIGQGFGQAGWSDEQIRHELHGSGKTFHTRDRGYYKAKHCHATYCLVIYDVAANEMAEYIRKFLRHPQFNTHAKRLGKVIKVTPTHIEYWEVKRSGKIRINW